MENKKKQNIKSISLTILGQMPQHCINSSALLTGLPIHMLVCLSQCLSLSVCVSVCAPSLFSHISNANSD